MERHERREERRLEHEIIREENRDGFGREERREHHHDGFRQEDRREFENQEEFGREERREHHHEGFRQEDRRDIAVENRREERMLEHNEVKPVNASKTGTLEAKETGILHSWHVEQIELLATQKLLRRHTHDGKVHDIDLKGMFVRQLDPEHAHKRLNAFGIFDERDHEKIIFAASDNNDMVAWVSTISEASRI